MERINIKNKDYELEDKDAALILTLQELIMKLEKLRIALSK